MRCNMRVFLCPYGGFSLAIPMDAVLSVTLHHKKTEETVEVNQENLNTYISLPLLLNCAGGEPRHGIILKDGDDERLEKKTVLLTYEIESEIELAQNKIYPLPESFSAMKFSQYFMGMVFSKELILLLNPEQTVQNIKKEIKHD